MKKTRRPPPTGGEGDGVLPGTSPRQALPQAPQGVPSALPRERQTFFSKTFAAFSYPSFRYLWVGNFFGSGSMWIQQITLSWLIYDLTGSASMLGLINGIRTIPFAVTAPFAGVMADRFDRKWLMVVTQVFLAVVASLFAVDVALQRVAVWHLFVFTLLIGTGTGINQTTRQTVTANVVPRKDLMNAVALGAVSFNLVRVVGPAIGGILIGIIGMAGNFFIQAGCYVGTTLMVFPMRLLREKDGDGPRVQSFVSSMGAGFRYLAKDRAVMSLIILGLVPMLFIFPINALMPIFAKDYFHMGPTGFGVLLTATGAGSLVGTMVLAAFGNFQRKARVFYVALTVAISMSIAFSWTRSLPLALLVLGVQGAFQMVYFSLNNATLQLLTPDNMRGRVMSLNMLDTAVIPLGGLLAGLLADAFSAPLAITILGIAGLVFIACAFITLPAVRKL